MKITMRVARLQKQGCWQKCGMTIALILLVGLQNFTATLEDSLTVSYKTKYASAA